MAAALGGMERTSGYMRVGEPDHANSKHEWAGAKVAALIKAQADLHRLCDLQVIQDLNNQ